MSADVAGMAKSIFAKGNSCPSNVVCLGHHSSACHSELRNNALAHLLGDSLLDVRDQERDDVVDHVLPHLTHDVFVQIEVVEGEAIGPWHEEASRQSKRATIEQGREALTDA